jgi:hypothetical protein
VRQLPFSLRDHARSSASKVELLACIDHILKYFLVLLKIPIPLWIRFLSSQYIYVLQIMKPVPYALSFASYVPVFFHGSLKEAERRG